MRKVFASLLIACVMVGPSGATLDREHQVKAAFIANFVKYIDWPELPNDGSNFVVGIYGAEGFGHDLEDAVAGKTVGRHPIVIQQLHADADIHVCRLIVSGATSEERIAKLMKACNSAGAVLVGEGPEFAKRGGTIGLELVSDRIRFDVNLEAARKSHVTLSSRLLSFARTVYK